MSASERITIIRDGNRIIVDPTTKRVGSILCPKLVFTEKVFLRGKEYYDAKKANKPVVYDQSWEVYTRDFRNRLATSAGFTHRITTLLSQRGYEVGLKDLTKYSDPKVFEPRWERIYDGYHEIRHKQDEALLMIASYDCGRIDCPPGWGKGTVIRMACELFPKAKIAVVTKRLPVLMKRLYPELAGALPDVGIVCSGKRQPGRRVMCYSAGCIPHADGDEDFVFVDEGHEAGADDYSSKLCHFRRARMWMFSASWNMRLDNKDIRTEALAGPIRLRVSYAEAQEKGMVVPIKVILKSVVRDDDPAAEITDATRKERACIWAHKKRNRLIAKDARKYDENTQVLITCDHLEHALRLKQLLPEFTVVHAIGDIDPKKFRRFKRWKLIPEKFKPMTAKRYERLVNAYSSGKLKKVICTTTWNTGVDFKSLQVLVRTDGGGSPINDIQIPGRASRINDHGKEYAIIHDYLDQFNTGYARKALGRVKSYKRCGWKCVFPKNHLDQALRSPRKGGHPDED